ncbi:MAG TPA: ABC transporter ATP-binding protein [Solirubrobacteraceae bacterium]
MSAPLLACRGMSVARGRREVLRSVDLELRAGEVVALLGPNGAGKSTLLGALAGAVDPVAGAVESHGRVAVALQSPDLARRSVLSNVVAALAWWGVPRAERRDRALGALATLGAEHLARRPASELSGGERRRVHLARAIAVRPDVLMLDEPFAGLDGSARSDLLADVAGVVRDPARATLVVVHDRAEAWALADRLVVLIDGAVLADGAPGELLATPPNAAVARFLGYDGELRCDDGGELLLTRPSHVALDPGGPLRGTVTRVIPTEDGARVELALDQGTLSATVDGPPPAAGTSVTVALRGGVRFPA